MRSTTGISRTAEASFGEDKAEASFRTPKKKPRPVIWGKIRHQPSMHDWPHSPIHLLDSSGAYIITAATYRKVPIFRSRDRLDRVLSHFHAVAMKYGIAIQAWAMFPNHYHFVGVLDHSSKLSAFVQHFHSVTAREVNGLDSTPGRKVWFQYWESHLTFERSYFARLRYVHENPVRHGVARVASNYPWCSAAWFEREAEPSFRKTISRFPCDKIDVPDGFEVKSTDF